MDDEPTAEEASALVKFQEVRSLAITVKSRETALAFRPRPSDVLVSTAPKCGTTWMTQICHQLRSGGSMDFDEITRVVPFLEAGLDLGQDINADHPWQPRVFKTHLSWKLCPQGGKYIIVVRHPYDVSVSQWRFHQGLMFPDGAIRCNTYVQQVWVKNGMRGVQHVSGGYVQSGTALHHFMSWWPHRHDDNVLFMFYEDLRQNLEGSVRMVADFLGVTDTQSIEAAVRMSTFDYMFENRKQFDGGFIRSARISSMGLPLLSGKGVGHVVSGGGNRDLLNEKTRSLIDELWRVVCQPVTNAGNYEEWRSMFHAEQ